MKRLFVLFFLFSAGAFHLHAQAIGGHKGGARFAANRGDLQIGVAGSYLRPDYGPGTGYQLNPYVALDYRRSYFGLEVDGNLTVHDKSEAHPNSAILGIRLGGDIGNARVYIKPGIGIGHFSGVTTAPSGHSQSYLVYELGGGVDYQLLDHMNVRLFGAYQVWPNFDGDTTAQFDHGGVLNPINAGIGVAYRF